MKKIKAFNFIELMMVMLILGIIITLTMPLIKNIKEDDDIYRSYMKKANQEVIDSFTMGLMRNPTIRDMSVVATASLPAVGTPNCNKIRNIFNDAINGISCNQDNIVTYHLDANGKRDAEQENENDACISNIIDSDFPNDLDLSGQPFIVLGGKSTMIFQYAHANAADPIYGYVYVDMNGNKSPNQMCKDRYRFIIYRNSVAMDTDTNGDYGCSLDLNP